MSGLTFIDKFLIRWGIVTKNYRKYQQKMQERLDINWRHHHVPDYWTYWHKCRSCDWDFTGEYDMAIMEYHLTAKAAYMWVFDEFINK